MAMVNPAVLNLAAAANAKDSRWLTLEVCREFQRSKCTRSDQECKFAHPPPHVEVQSGRVTACFDSIKGKCQRKEPPCKYLHPPQHLREQLLQNGRNNLILKNLQFQAAQQAALNQGLMSGLIPVAGANKTTMAFPHTVLSAGQYSPMLAHPYLGGTAPPTTAVAFSPYMNAGLQTVTVTGAQTNCESPALVSQHHGVIPTAFSNMAAANKVARPDRLEMGIYYEDMATPHVVEVLTGKKRPRDPSEEMMLSQVPGMMGQIKRVAMADTKGLPMYQPFTNVSYQQAIAAMQLQHQPQYIPVSFAGQPPSVQRF
ncbi:hypothetical protein DPMN_133747 [Dreissena polymorpha]|uniref:C3H1-type domain-containing protein n=1 Tax=Dreissena polymorpha TaxID=45954 RepID=A0A9D4JD66_DREPO|nr:hypothetical protein DPMN_133747 [Dreissena polymorpha]